MDTNTEKLLLKDEVFQVIGCANKVPNTLGHGRDFLYQFVSIRVHGWLIR
jgi:hypothetical protein